MQKLHTYHLFVIVDVQKLIVGNPPPPPEKNLGTFLKL